MKKGEMEAIVAEKERERLIRKCDAHVIGYVSLMRLETCDSIPVKENIGDPWSMRVFN